jgi:Domain of unknown function (DUF2017)
LRVQEDLRIRRRPDGDFDLDLPRNERDILRTLPEVLRGAVTGDDPAAQRLFPPAHPGDPVREEEYRRLTRESLVGKRLFAIEVVEATLDAERLDEEQLSAWLGALNDLRLVLGSRLEVTEESYDRDLDPGDPQAPAMALYHYLSWLVAQAVDALADGLPEEGAG